MQIAHSVLAIACVAVLGACSSVPGHLDHRSGIVAGVYVETAPGLFVERGLATRGPGASVALVNLGTVASASGATATAWLASGTAVTRGDVVHVRLGRDDGRASEGVVPVTDRVISVVAARDGAVAATGFDYRR